MVLAARLADIPDLDAALPSSVDILGGVADGDSTHHLTMVQVADWSSVTGDAGAQ